MQIQDLYSAFIAGRQLPNLGTRTARALLDMARSALLRRGKRLKPSTATPPDTIKEELLEAHRALVGGEPVYNSAAPQETCSIQEAEQCLAMLRANNATKKPSNKITAAATTTPARATTPKPMTSTKAKATTTRPTGKTPTPAHLIGSSVDHAGLATRAALQAAVRRPAVTPKAPPPRPLEGVPTAALVSLATHRFSQPADAAAARAELAARPGVSLYENGSYSVSSRGTRTAK